MPLTTPDGRYIVVGGRLWRAANPHLDEEERSGLVADLMAARRAVRTAKGDAIATRRAREDVERTKRGLGERGPVWWDDGAPDYNRRLVGNTPYAAWFATVDDAEGALAKTDGPRPLRSAPSPRKRN